MANPMTLAYIGYGVREALNDHDVSKNVDAFEGEIHFVGAVVALADALDAELERRYRGGGHPFVYEYEVAEEFGRQAAIALSKDELADPADLIKKIYDAADQDYTEPVDKAVLVVGRFPDLVPAEQVWRTGVFDDEETAIGAWRRAFGSSSGAYAKPEFIRCIEVSTAENPRK